MFDTIILKSTNIEIDINILNQYEYKDFSYYDSNKNLITKIEFQLEYLHIKYYLQTKTLAITASVARVINKINNLIQGIFELETFWRNLDELLLNYLQITVDKEEWTVSRLDTTHDIQTKNIEQAVEKLSKLSFSKYTKNLYNDNEGITFSNKTSAIVIYNKQEQYRSIKENEANIQAAANILRIEIRPSRYTMKQYDSTRKAVNLLTREYAEYILEKYHFKDLMTQIKKHNRKKNFTPLSVSNIKNIETAAGFNYLINTYGEKKVKESMTLSTFKNRKRLIKNLNL
ncbi:hypothetical protein CON65_05880 [Bacillus pseudomycoides]|uniref:Replication-associated protein G2P N-terminal domain-containing protein n=1 Tax=Bacillus pseudomycoides TaxID=64104 RepID=A0AA91VEZ4_9BACI|nr:MULTISPECIES: phage/plasmid replication protein [Bacillus]PEB56977.1 hypothetical protein COO03_00315 [Bacillus sp. AFS098217]PED83403.1 hypothetical protein CON65_05880 [Bacillus pseudomycoides]PEU14945.1 hypothetical protein CN525_18115 [Bacillus sp. AFS014408]PEU15341.1 hypothetical protein CN524_07215 [Bacillus sp. AFS019443]PFW61085.1 hypothetical protein COL20_19140 [Bacillus sp. AFS075034]